MLTAAVLAALAGWWAAGPAPRRPPLGARPARGRPEGVIARRTRALLGAGLAVVAAQVVPGPWWLAVPAAVAIGAAAYAGLGLIGPDPRAEEAERRRHAAEALVLLASAVEAGLPLAAAVSTVAPGLPGAVGRDLQRVVSGSDIGLAQREAWAALDASAVWRRAAADIGRVATSGAAVAPVLRRHAALLADAERDARLRAARTTGVRSVFPLSVCFLPAFVLVGIVPAVGGVVTRFLG